MRRLRWRIEEVEGELAAVEAGPHRLDLPLAILPAGAREGWVLAVEVERQGEEAATLRIVRDPEGAAADLRRAGEALRRLAEGDPEGDLHL